jgi:hypothetical protein
VDVLHKAIRTVGSDPGNDGDYATQSKDPMKRLMILLVVAASALLLAATSHAATITGARDNGNGADVTWTLAPNEYPINLTFNGESACPGAALGWLNTIVSVDDGVPVGPGATSCGGYVLSYNRTTNYTIQLQTCIAVTDYTYGFANTVCDVANPLLSAPFTFIATTIGTSGVKPKSYYEWSDETTIENGLESHGIARAAFPRVLHRHLNVDSALCIGLRRYGTKLSDDGFTTTYKRFKCTLDASNGHLYAATVDWAGNVLTLKRDI